MRLIIIAILVYLCYRTFKKWALKHAPGTNAPVTDRNANAIDDVMVKDPQCQVYFPKRKGIPLNIDGEELLFCSEACRDQYLAEKNNHT
jgi:YHS domain-containing protein